MRPGKLIAFVLCVSCFLTAHSQDLQTLLDSSDYYWGTQQYNKAFLKLNDAKLVSEEAYANKEENGIITAKEIAQLNLQNNMLVVLSACETGRGKLIDGQGVYGLQRAFQVAGADHVVISLWKVDDEATKELMTLFYQEYLTNHNPRKALKTAQIELKKNTLNPFIGAPSML
ncbi:MAG: CHAT domain-containing protein [Cyclobacteriaceae bacterium]